MGRNTVRTIVGWIIVCGHIAILAYIFTFKSDTWDWDRQSGAALTVAPVFAAYFVAVVRTFVEKGTEFDRGPAVNANYVAITILVPSCLILAVAYTVYLFPSEGFAEPDKLQKALAGLETCLGGAVGFIVSNLFPAQQANPK